MRRSVPFSLVVLALAGAVSLAILPLSAQTRATATNVAVIPHEAVPNFFKNPPGIYTGENMGIATNSKGNIYIYHRANETRLFEYSPQGAFIREIGRGNYGFAFAHSVRVDAQDNIWAVDEGTDMIVKFSPEGKVLMTIGRRAGSGRPRSATCRDRARFHGRNEKYRFGRETDVAFDQQGNIFVVRRLLRRARREVRQERPLREGRRQARHAATSSSTRRTRSPPTSRATSTSAIAATRACRCSTTI